MAAREQVPRHLFVAVGEAGCVEGQRAGQSPEDLCVRQALAERLDGRQVQRHVEMAPRVHQVEMLDLGGGGQHDVGIAGGVGHELLDDHREQVVALETR